MLQLNILSEAKKRKMNTTEQEENVDEGGDVIHIQHKTHINRSVSSGSIAAAGKAKKQKHGY